MRHLKLVSVFLFLLCALSAHGRDSTRREPFIRIYDNVSFLSGIPLNEPVTSESADIKFRLGLRTRALWSPGGWGLFLAYRQSAVWNAYGKSGPFRDILFQPGLYFEKNIGAHTLTTGLEHLSNGRPYYGNPLAEAGYDDGSRGMNYILFRWSYENGGHAVSVLAKAGAGCGVGSYERHEMMFTQDLFLYYFGYITFGYSYSWQAISAHADVTPLFNESVANVTADAAWTFAKGWPALTLEFHYGYDETMCRCSPIYGPMCNLRLGLKYVPTKH